MINLDELNALNLVFVEDDESELIKATSIAGNRYFIRDRRMTIASAHTTINEVLPNEYNPIIKYSRKRMKSRLLHELTQLVNDMQKCADMAQQYDIDNTNAKELRTGAINTQLHINKIILDDIII